MKKRTLTILTAVAFSVTASLSAQEKKKDWGSLHGGIESNAAFYKKDDNLPDAKKHGNNTYLNLKYDYRNFSAGLQYEIFEPPMRSFENLKGNALTQYYANYSDSKINVTLGSFYEQYGSGLIFRAYEERALGVNNSLRGLNVKYSPTDWLNVKVMGGQPRRYLTYADAVLWGGDAEFSISKLWNREASYDITLGGSWVGRHNTETVDKSPDPTNTNLYSIRTGFSNALFNFGVEYTGKGASQSFAESVGDFVSESGDALLVTMDYTRENFGVSGIFRRIEHMDFRIDNKKEIIYIPMNYVPALTKQHKYALPALYPHQSNLAGEIGGQLDVYWDIKAGWLGKYPLKVSINTSHYKSLGLNVNETMPFFGRDGKELFTEASIELGKRLSSSVKANLGIYFQKVNHNSELLKSFIQVADVLWKINRKASLRTEVQHMKTDMPEKGWLYGLIEFGLAPHWSVYVNDMYSYGAEKKEHYYNFGGSFTYKSLRLTAAYGRTRAGTQCVGGICRFVPEYQGATVGLSYVF